MPREQELRDEGEGSMATVVKSGVCGALSAWVFAVHFCGCISSDPAREFGGRWTMLSSWALLLSVAYWLLSAAHTWFWGTELSAQIGPFLEIVWPLVFGSATYSAFLFFAVLTPTTPWTNFDPAVQWLCAEAAPWRGPPPLQLLICHAVPCLLAYWEACGRRQLPSPSAVRASNIIVNVFVTGFFANACISYSACTTLPPAQYLLRETGADTCCALIGLVGRANASMGLPTWHRRVQLLAGSIPGSCGILAELQDGCIRL